MERIVLTKELRAQGYQSAEVARLVQSGALSHIRHGAYVLGAQPDEADHGRAEHRRAIEATLQLSLVEAVVSHMSAAVLHGLPTWNDELDVVHLTRNRTGGGRRRRHVRVYGFPYGDDDVVQVGGLPATSVARTVIDLACQQPLIRSVPIGDAALRTAARATPPIDLRGDLVRQLSNASGRKGVLRARQAIELMDPLSESVGESYSRVRLVEAGLPSPMLQYEVWSADGGLLGRADFAWPEYRTLGEFDGIVKYSGRYGQTTQGALVAEKRREDRMRDEGWQVVRWTWDELAEPVALIDRLEHAFARGGRNPLEPLRAAGQPCTG